MFANAYDKVSKFTHPVIISYRLSDGSVNSEMGAFIVINKEGWAMTAAHLLKKHFIAQQDAKEIAEYEKAILEIRSDIKIDEKHKKKKIQKLAKKNWITLCSYWWGWNGVSGGRTIFSEDGDIAIVKLEGFENLKVYEYPVFMNPDKLRMGRSLCKLGFPFHNISVSYNEEKKGFDMAPNAIPVPIFPIEGIYTRNCIMEREGGKENKFLETSSPGLRGQSGGPIFDVNGFVWAIQSSTLHIPLGFNPKIKLGQKEVEEHQFINVGLGVHPEIIIKIMRDNKIDFKISSD